MFGMAGDRRGVDRVARHQAGGVMMPMDSVGRGNSVDRGVGMVMRGGGHGRVHRHRQHRHDHQKAAEQPHASDPHAGARVGTPEGFPQDRFRHTDRLLAASMDADTLEADAEIDAGGGDFPPPLLHRLMDAPASSA